MKPPKIKIDTLVKTISVMNLTDNPKHFKRALHIDSLSYIDLSNDGLKEFKNTIKNTNLFDSLSVYYFDNSTIGKNKTEIFSKNKSDIIISLDKLDILGRNDTWYNVGEDNHYYNVVYFTIYLKTKWSIFDTKQKKVIKNIKKEMISSFDYQVDNVDSILAVRPDYYDYSDVVKEISVDVAELLLPYWKETYRKYFLTKNDEMDLTELNILVGDWEGAAKIWEKFAVGSNHRLAKYATFNLALAYEMKGDLDKAYQMASYSFHHYFNWHALFYKMKLKKRLKYEKLFRNQFGN